jgi:Lrp/AsnC family transcriptional regulator for asnA, asnC and gidA
MAVDTTDRRLIRLLQDNPRSSYAELARTVGISESTARRRVEGLFADGIIVSSVMPDVRALGYEISLIGIRAELGQLEEIASRLRDCEAVTMVLLTLGRFDVFVAVALPSVDAIYPFLREHIAPLPGVRDVETFLAPTSIKIFRDWRVPWTDDGESS